ncbi:MAG: alpha/beta hydrolase family protein [Planctomycetes bacterium]|nr:alpha/beta hydrolase family protein [Planctomycetota bacterium]
MRFVLGLLLAAPLAVQDGVRAGMCRPRPVLDAPTALRAFAVPPDAFEWKLHPVHEKEKVSIYDLTFPSAVTTDVEENNTVWGRVWWPKSEERSVRKPGVIILHYLKGTFDPLHFVGYKLAESGIASMLLYMPHYGKRRPKDPQRRTEMITPDMEGTIANFHQAVKDIRRAGEWLASRPDIDPTRVGLFGVSLGAVVGALAAGVEPRFSRNVFVLGGGDLPGIVLNDSREVREVRERLLEEGWTREKLAPRLRAIDPLTYADRIDPYGTLMFNAERDQVVPRSSTEKLAEAMGGAKIRWLKGDHYTIALSLPLILKEAVAHLKARSWY